MVRTIQMGRNAAGQNAVLCAVPQIARKAMVKIGLAVEI
jgi:hypothetical protein